MDDGLEPMLPSTLNMPPMSGTAEPEKTLPPARLPEPPSSGPVVSPDEMPPGLARRLSAIDRNGNGAIDPRDAP